MTKKFDAACSMFYVDAPAGTKQSKSKRERGEQYQCLRVPKINDEGQLRLTVHWHPEKQKPSIQNVQTHYNLFTLHKKRKATTIRVTNSNIPLNEVDRKTGMYELKCS